MTSSTLCKALYLRFILGCFDLVSNNMGSSSGIQYCSSILHWHKELNAQTTENNGIISFMRLYNTGFVWFYIDCKIDICMMTYFSRKKACACWRVGSWLGICAGSIFMSILRGRCGTVKLSRGFKFDKLRRYSGGKSWPESCWQKDSREKGFAVKTQQAYVTFVWSMRYGPGVALTLSVVHVDQLSQKTVQRLNKHNFCPDGVSAYSTPSDCISSASFSMLFAKYIIQSLQVRLLRVTLEFFSQFSGQGSHHSR